MQRLYETGELKGIARALYEAYVGEWERRVKDTNRQFYGD